MIYTHVLKVAAGGTASPLDSIAFEPSRTVLRNVSERLQRADSLPSDR
jgi:hypothetical protein